MIDIGLKNIKKAYGAFEILSDVSFDIQENDKIGLIGRNGTGKTTVFRIISGREDINGGNISVRKNIKISCLDQISEYPQNFTVEDVLNSAFEKLFDLKGQLEIMGKQLGESHDEELEKLLEKYGEMQNEFENLGGYEIETKKSKICTGLKINEEFLSKDFSVLSGGEKTIVNLGKILLENPEVLLLDEPSNHLDITAIEWLEEYLKNYKGSIVIISHDRYFLDRTVNKIIELEDGTSDVFHGNFSYYKVEKESRLLAEFEAYKDQQKKVNAMKEAAKRYRIWARGDHDKFFKKAKELEKKIEKIEMLDRPQLDRKGIGLAFNGQKRSGKNVVICKKLSKSFESEVVFENIDLTVYFKERVALLGKNGCGKSTLLKIILGQLQPDSGTAELGASVKSAYLDQNIEFADLSKTVLDTYREECKVYEGVARNQLSNFLFTKDEVFKKVSELSGGERTRLKLALLMQNDTNLLILDEPTNHLDIDSKEMLEEALKSFNGTILFVSHDRYFINQISGRIVELSDVGIKSYEGDYDYYKECKSKEEISISQPVKEKKEVVFERVQKKGLSKYTIEQTEKKIEQVEAEIHENNKIMESNPDDHEKVTQAYNKIKELEIKLEELYYKL
jgi:ATPase subunit of ABC transporter with duplicated ATPase domains